MPVARFPLVGSITNRNVNPASFSGKDQLFQNCYPEIVRNQITGQTAVTLNKRPGTVQSSSLSVASVINGSLGSTLWTGNSAETFPGVFSYVMSGGASLRFYTAETGPTLIGATVSNVSACVTMSETLISGTSNLTASLIDSASGIVELWFFPEGGSWTQNTDGDLPTGIQAPHCHMDGYEFFITRPGVLWNTDVNSLSAVTATSFIAVQSMPDKGVGVARQRDFIVAFGDYSFEMFYNAGNATGSPLLPVAGSVRRIGALRSTATARTIAEFGDSVYWIGVEADSSKIGIYRLNGAEPQKISNAAIDKLLNQGEIFSIIGYFTSHGMSHIMFGGGSAVKQWCFCVDTGFWWKFLLGTGLQIGSIIGRRGKFYFTSPDTNQFFLYLSEVDTSYQDFGNAYTASVTTAPLDFGTNRRKFFRRVSLIGDTEASSVDVSYSDDDYTTGSVARSVSMSARNPSLYRWGSARRRAWAFAHASNTPWRLEAVEIEYEVGN